MIRSFTVILLLMIALPPAEAIDLSRRSVLIGGLVAPLATKFSPVLDTNTTPPATLRTSNALARYRATRRLMATRDANIIGTRAIALETNFSGSTGYLDMVTKILERYPIEAEPLIAEFQKYSSPTEGNDFSKRVEFGHKLYQFVRTFQ